VFGYVITNQMSQCPVLFHSGLRFSPSRTFLIDVERETFPFLTSCSFVPVSNIRTQVSCVCFYGPIFCNFLGDQYSLVQKGRTIEFGENSHLMTSQSVLTNGFTSL